MEKRAKPVEPGENGQTAFKRFEELTRKLVRVPKKEVQEAEARRKKRSRS